MVGARSLAMALNRLIDMGIDARNPRTAGRELPSGALTVGAVRRVLPAARSRCSCRGLAARPGRALALADPGRGVRDLPVPQALHVALPPLARRGRRARADGRLGRGHRQAAVGGLGARRRRRHLGRRASTSSTRSSTSRSTARRGCTPGRCASASAARSSARGCMHVATVVLLVAVGLGLDVDWWYWAGVVVVAGLLAYEHSLVRPGRPAAARRGVLHDERRDQRRVLRLRPRGRSLDPGTVRRRGLRHQAVEALRREARLEQGRRRASTPAGSCSSPGRTARARRRSCACSPGLDAPTARRARAARPRRDRLPRPRAARLPRADAAREPAPVRPALPRPRAGRADRDAARALRPLGGARPARLDVLARNAPAARALPRAPARAGAGRCSTSRSTRSTPPARRCSTRRSTSCTARAPCRRHPRSRPGRAPRDPAAGVRMRYFSDVAALARKDLLIELRAKETVPAMLLFVLSALTIFHFAVPSSRCPSTPSTRSRSACSGPRSSSPRCSG